MSQTRPKLQRSMFNGGDPNRVPRTEYQWMCGYMPREPEPEVAVEEPPTSEWADLASAWESPDVVNSRRGAPARSTDPPPLVRRVNSRRGAPALSTGGTPRVHRALFSTDEFAALFTSGAPFPRALYQMAARVSRNLAAATAADMPVMRWRAPPNSMSHSHVAGVIARVVSDLRERASFGFIVDANGNMPPQNRTGSAPAFGSIHPPPEESHATPSVPPSSSAESEENRTGSAPAFGSIHPPPALGSIHPPPEGSHATPSVPPSSSAESEEEGGLLHATNLRGVMQIDYNGLRIALSGTGSIGELTVYR